MDRKVFLENLMEYIKENMNEENVRFFKKSIKFRKVNHLYGEIFFEHSRNFEGYTVYISIESKTLAKFLKKCMILKIENIIFITLVLKKFFGCGQ